MQTERLVKQMAELKKKVGPDTTVKRYTKKYYDGFKDWESLRIAHCDRRDWEDGHKEELAGITPVKEPSAVFAFYEYEDYSGRSMIVFKHKNKWWVNEAGHCSCYGLEGTWKPTAHSKKEIERMFITNNWRLKEDNIYSYPEAHDFVRWWKKHSKTTPKKKVAHKVTVIEISSGKSTN